MSEPRMYAMVTDQSTAASETALCERCATEPLLQAVASFAESDVVKGRGFVDCSGNEALVCVCCGEGDEDDALPCAHARSIE